MGGEGTPGGLGERELADLAGVPVTLVRRAAELGILRPGGRGAALSPSAGR